jgi:prepilin-type N-terminal cleavage/methylation domain-containing protein
MRNQGKQNQAMTLTELLVVMSVMVILLAIAAPVAKKLSQSLGESTGTRSIIAAAMSNARAIAVRDQKYAGVRFQQDSGGKQYLVLIIHDPNAVRLNGYSLANGFRAIQGKRPMALPDDVGVISCRVQSDYDDGTTTDWDLTDNPTAANTGLNNDAGRNDAATFSIVFSPSGKFVVHPVRVYSVGVNDAVFNSKAAVIANTAKFRRDAGEDTSKDIDAQQGYQEENSVPSFKIYSKKELDKVDATLRWSGYLSGLDKEFVNPYTGELIKK